MNKFTQTNNIAVSAGAGTGKTWTLSRRYINALLGFEFFFEDEAQKFSAAKAEKESALPGEILTITYTDAAASEMKSRINELIADIIRGIEGKKTREKDIVQRLETFSSAGEYIKEKLLNARRYMSRARISTIHSFSGSLVKEYAYLLRSDLGSRVIDVIEKSDIIDLIKKEVIAADEERYLESRFLLSSFRLDTLLEKYISDSRFRENFDQVAEKKNSLNDMKPFLQKWKITENLAGLYEALAALDNLKNLEVKDGAWVAQKDWFLARLNIALDGDVACPKKPQLRTNNFEASSAFDSYKALRDIAGNLVIETSKPIEKRFLQVMKIVDSYLKEVFLKYRQHLKSEGKTDFDMTK